jgi:ADP-ribosylglycohydrolase
MKNDRARGALLGMAVGDALGTTQEFARLEQPAYPALATGPANDVVGKGPFGLEPGMITDDTQMAVCLARTLTRHGRVDVAELGQRYVAWTEHAFDIGNQTRASLQLIEGGTPARLAGFEVWQRADRRPAGNGSLMRSAPIGVALRGEALLDAAIADSMITHADPRCILACCAFDAAIAAYIDDQGNADPIAVARAALAAGARRLRETWQAFATPEDLACIETAAAALAGDLDAAQASDPQVYGSDLHIDRTSGFVRLAFRLAFWHAVHTKSWRAALVDIASRGGDADTNAAIAGALLGARDGAEAIPVEWELRVLTAMLPGPAWWIDAHHPRLLFGLL